MKNRSWLKVSAMGLVLGCNLALASGPDPIDYQDPSEPKEAPSIVYIREQTNIEVFPVPTKNFSCETLPNGDGLAKMTLKRSSSDSDIWYQQDQISICEKLRKTLGSFTDHKGMMIVGIAHIYIPSGGGQNERCVSLSALPKANAKDVGIVLHRAEVGGLAQQRCAAGSP